MWKNTVTALIRQLLASPESVQAVELYNRICDSTLYKVSATEVSFLGQEDTIDLERIDYLFKKENIQAKAKNATIWGEIETRGSESDTILATYRIESIDNLEPTV